MDNAHLTSPTPPFLSLATWDFPLHQTSPLQSAAGCYSSFVPTPTGFPWTNAERHRFDFLFASKEK